MATDLADFYVEYLGCCFQGFTPCLQSPIMLFSCFALKWRRIGLYPKRGTGLAVHGTGFDQTYVTAGMWI